MTDKMKIDLALANLEAGKFSFRMIDAIKDHIGSLESELAVVRGLHASARRDLKQRDLAIWRLEGEVTKLNARIYALLRANVLTERACVGMAVAAVHIRAYAEDASNAGAAVLAQLMADAKSGKLQSQCADAAAEAYGFLKNIMPPRSALEDMKSYAQKAGDHLTVAWKFVAEHSAKASAYLATLNKDAA
jgi:hypothetical protein